MDNISLLNSTQNQQVDVILRGIIGIFETVFPNRIRGYYLRGSYADGTALSTSDLDVDILFIGDFTEDEGKKARHICQCCHLISPVELDLFQISEGVVFDFVAIYGMRLKHGSLLIYGQDIRGQIPMPPTDVFVRELMHNAFHLLTRDRRNHHVLTFPLDYSQPDAQFYGYVQPASVDEEASHNMKAFIRRICWAVTAIIALKAGKYVAKKRDAIRLYRECVNDEWASLLEQLWEKCHKEWETLVPQDKTGRKQLRNLCQRVLAFENHFTEIYRDYLLSELESAKVENKRRAVKQLGEIIYPDEEVVEVLQALESDANEELEQAIKETLERIHEVQSRRL